MSRPAISIALPPTPQSVELAQLASAGGTTEFVFQPSGPDSAHEISAFARAVIEQQ